MATRSYTIHSCYEADEKEHESQVEQFEQRTAEDVDEHWQYNKYFGPSRLPPRFVPAKYSDSERIVTQSPSVNTPSLQSLSSLEWYRSICSSAASPSTPSYTPPDTPAGPSKVPALRHAQPTPVRPSPMTTSASSSSNRIEPRTKQNWFIMNAIESQARTEPSTPAPSLAAMIARDPPPMPTEKNFKPPVWLDIGPSNRGFAMLQRSGWNEGEPLGPDVIRRPKSHPSPESMALRVKRERREIRLGPNEDGLSEVRDVDVIDLTEDDLEDPLSTSNVATLIPEEGGSIDAAMDIGDSGGRMALITPIPTILKADRLGIGLKAKTEGPYKRSRKRVTHNQFALTAHMQAAADQRRRIKEMGRGRRGFQRQHEKTAQEQQNLLAYLNG